MGHRGTIPVLLLLQRHSQFQPSPTWTHLGSSRAFPTFPAPLPTSCQSPFPGQDRVPWTSCFDILSSSQQMQLTESWNTPSWKGPFPDFQPLSPQPGALVVLQALFPLLLPSLGRLIHVQPCIPEESRAWNLLKAKHGAGKSQK